MPLSNTFLFHRNSNIEQVDILTNSNLSDNELFDAAFQNLNRLNVLINSSHLHASLLSIEKIYNLDSPLINPFSDLRHNPITLVGVKRNDKFVIDHCKEILHKHSKADLRLYPIMNKKFADQINKFSISQEDLHVRYLIHKQQLINPNYFMNPEVYDFKDVKAFCQLAK